MPQVGQLNRLRAVISIGNPDLLIPTAGGGKRKPLSIVRITRAGLATRRRDEFDWSSACAALGAVPPNRKPPNPICEDERRVAAGASGDGRNGGAIRHAEDGTRVLAASVHLPDAGALAMRLEQNPVAIGSPRGAGDVAKIGHAAWRARW